MNSTRLELEQQLDRALTPIRARLDRLEAELFPKRPPGGTGPGGGVPERLQKLKDRLESLAKEVEHRLGGVDTKIREVIRTIAELRDIVEENMNPRELPRPKGRKRGRVKIESEAENSRSGFEPSPVPEDESFKNEA